MSSDGSPSWRARVLSETLFIWCGRMVTWRWRWQNNRHRRWMPISTRTGFAFPRSSCAARVPSDDRPGLVAREALDLASAASFDDALNSRLDDVRKFELPVHTDRRAEEAVDHSKAWQQSGSPPAARGYRSRTAR